MARKARRMAGAAKKKKKAPRKTLAAGGARKKVAGKASKTGSKSQRKAAGRKKAGSRKTGARRKRNAEPQTITGKIASALQAVVDAVTDSDLLHRRPQTRPRPETE